MYAQLRSYPVIDNSGDNDARNTGIRRFSPVGTLLHSTAGLSSLSWLTVGAARAGTPATTNYLIDRDGTRHKLVTETRYAYHAGASSLIYGDYHYVDNDVSQLLISIELENMDSTLCDIRQVDSCAECIVLEGLQWGWRWPYYVVGHYEVARPRGRRLDPLGFPWGDFAGRLYAHARDKHIGGLD